MRTSKSAIRNSQFAILLCVLCALAGNVFSQTAARYEISGTGVPGAAGSGVMSVCVVTGSGYSQTYINRANGDHYNCSGVAGTTSGVWVLNGNHAAGTGSVTSVSVTTANGVSGSVANPTTTPAITLTLGDITPSKVTQTTNAIGATSTDGIVLQNTTAAAAGAQQWSPRLHLRGNGWKTNALASSRNIDVIGEVQPVQGTNIPSFNFAWSGQINNTGYFTLLTLNSSTGLSVPNLIESSSGGFKFPDATIQTTAAVAGITNSAGPNVVPKSDGTNLVASQITDNGNDVAVGSSNTTLAVNESTTSISMAAASSISIDSNGGTTTIGDVEGDFTSAKLIVDAASGVLVLNTNFSVGGDLLPTDPTSHNIGSASIPFSSVFVGNAANQTAQITCSTCSANRVFDFPDKSGTPALNFTATSASIGGGALLAGACASTATTVTGAASGMATIATPNTYPGDGNYWLSYVSAANTVTVKVCAAIAGTPTASTYNIRVIQ